MKNSKNNNLLEMNQEGCSRMVFIIPVISLIVSIVALVISIKGF